MKSISTSALHRMIRMQTGLTARPGGRGRVGMRVTGVMPVSWQGNAVELSGA